MTPPQPRDPLLQPFRLKHLTLRNRVMPAARAPARSRDGLSRAPAGVARLLRLPGSSPRLEPPPALAAVRRDDFCGGVRAETVAGAGAPLEIVTPERFFAAVFDALRLCRDV